MDVSLRTTEPSCVSCRNYIEEDKSLKNVTTIEIIKKIFFAVVTPFANIAFGFLSIFRIAYNTFFERKKVIQDVDFGMLNERLRGMVFGEIRDAKIEEIQSAKVFINVDIDSEGEKFIKDYIFKPIDTNESNGNFLGESIDSIMKDLKEFIQEKQCTKLDLQWDSLIRHSNITFTRIHGSVGEGSSYYSCLSGNWRNISLDRVEKVFEFVLKKMGRPIVPQLNDQSEFI